MKEKSGVSMITLVITIIVIIILASVAFNSSTETIGTANYSNYVNNVSEVQQAFSLAVANRKGEEAQKGKVKKTEQVVNAVATGSSTYKLNSEAKALAYTIIDESAEEELGIELPEMKVETLTADEVKVKYAVTPDGTVFAWPPIENDGEYHSAGDVTAAITETTGTITVESDMVELTISQETGELLPPSGDGTTSGNVGNYVKLTSITLGSLVTYPLSYTGLNEGTKYTAETGWKLLSATKKSNGNYDIEIISVGIPMGVYYHYEQIDSATWKGTEQDIANYNTKFSTTWSASEAKTKAASGLYYNLGSINFVGGTTTSSDINTGYFAKVGEIASGKKTGAELLKVSEILSNITGVRVATEEDIISIATTRNEVKELGSDYWLASPNSSSTDSLLCVDDEWRYQPLPRWRDGCTRCNFYL